MHKWLQSWWLLVSDDIIPLKLLIKVGALSSSLEAQIEWRGALQFHFSFMFWNLLSWFDWFSFSLCRLAIYFSSKWGSSIWTEAGACGCKCDLCSFIICPTDGLSIESPHTFILSPLSSYAFISLLPLSCVSCCMILSTNVFSEEL